MNALAFHFRPGKTFLRKPAHPITIPRSQVPYNFLRENGLDRGIFTMIYPHGEKMAARMYGPGVAGYGSYYQLHHIGEDRLLPEYLSSKTPLIIALVLVWAEPVAIVEFRP
jgi:hypothetical protein